MKFEIEFVGYMDFDDYDKAKKFAYEMEKSLGFLTRNDLNLYCSDVKRHNIPKDEKRFWIEDYGIWDYGKQLSWSELKDVLNELYNENLKLKGLSVDDE